MLTQSEKRWIAWKHHIKSIEHGAGAWCQYQNCPHLGRNAAGCYGKPYCPLFPDLADALEFEGRVAAKLAEVFMCVIDAEFDYQIPYNCAACPCKGKCSLDCKDSIMKWARLAVEEEMDGQDDA